MDAPDAALAPPCPPGASEAERRALGYSACARGSANSLLAYEGAAATLKARGILVPDMLASDLEQGFAVVSELKGRLLAEAAGDPQTEEELYLRAADILDRLRAEPASTSPAAAQPWPVQTYDRLAYETEAELLELWYLPKVLGRTLTDVQSEELLSAWREVLGRLSPPRHYVHRDFHAENLVLADEGIGVLDFQDLMVGQAAYDWASLIEDARRDLGQRTAELVYRRGVEGAADAEAFETDYAVLAAQRNAKILGLFTRLSHEAGKTRYEALFGRVRGHFARDLARPPLWPVRDALSRLAPELLSS
jgi:aminoglycoside/choline kinase family phosphotransferase